MTSGELSNPSLQKAQQEARGVLPLSVLSADTAITQKDDRVSQTISVLSIMTGETPENISKKIENPQTRIIDTERMKQFMQDNKDKIETAQKAENIEKLTQEQRDAMRQFLQTMGYAIDPKAYDGKSAKDQSKVLSDSYKNAQNDLGMNSADMMSFLLMGMIADALGLGNVFQGLLGSLGGRDTLGMRGSGFGGSKSGPAKFSSEPELEKIASNIQGKGTLAGVVNLANALDGQAEVGNNNGAIVRATMGYTGDPWCGGFVRYTFEKAGVEGVYNQSDYRMARSYMREGQKHGAFREAGSAYHPKPGDVITFSSSRGPGSGHVGIVTEIKGDSVTYMSGNDDDRVQARTISLSNLPGKVLGFTDTQALAKAKHIELKHAQIVSANVTPSKKGHTRDF